MENLIYLPEQQLKKATIYFLSIMMINIIDKIVIIFSIIGFICGVLSIAGNVVLLYYHLDDIIN